MSQEVRFAKCITALAEYYGKEISPGVVDLYWQGLCQYDVDTIDAAIGRHLQNPDCGQWMPRISDIVKAIEGTTQEASVMAWAKVMRAVGSVGQYQSIAFDDKLIHLAIEDIGGWPSVCQVSEDELPFLQRRFENAYRAYRRNAADAPCHVAYLAGVSEMQNRAGGFKVDPPRLVGDRQKAIAVLKSGGEKPRLPVHVVSAQVVQLIGLKRDAA